MGFDVHISTVLCERCKWIMQTYESGDFYCPNNACENVFVPFDLHLQMVRKEIAKHAQ